MVVQAAGALLASPPELRHRGTGLFSPSSARRKERGSSHQDPIDLLIVDGSAAERSSAALLLVIHVYLGSANTHRPDCRGSNPSAPSIKNPSTRDRRGRKESRGGGRAEEVTPAPSSADLHRLSLHHAGGSPRPRRPRARHTPSTRSWELATVSAPGRDQGTRQEGSRKKAMAPMFVFGGAG
jgi:hypothetical protein